MKRRIAITMRMAKAEYGELRDAVACQWYAFLDVVLPGCLVVPIPNFGEVRRIRCMVKELSLNGLILSGGEDIGVYPERDSTEHILFDWANEYNYPVLGICRGAQIINHLCGGSLVQVEGHRATRHTVTFNDGKTVEVNSYHNKGITESSLAPNLIKMAATNHGGIEALCWQDRPIIGLMWHPEREASVANSDQMIFKKLFGDYND